MILLSGAGAETLGGERGQGRGAPAWATVRGMAVAGLIMDGRRVLTRYPCGQTRGFDDPS